MSEQHVHDLAEMLGGRVESMERLPDGSGAATVSYPLPKDHWLTRPSEAYEAPPMGLRLGTASPLHEVLVREVRAAARYAVRASTMNGTEEDFDPDALVQNFVVGLLGYHTPDGLSDDEWANPEHLRRRDRDDASRPGRDEG